MLGVIFAYVWAAHSYNTYFEMLFNTIYAWQNLIVALKKAAQGKKDKSAVATFLYGQEKELLLLEKQLSHKTWCPGGYTSFRIYDPKERLISAAPFRDRVVHHALCNIIEPIFEKTFIYDAYANRKGKGTHRGIQRYQQYARRHRYVLKCDIKKFFPSLDHAILKQEIRWRIWCPDTLWLIDTIIDGSNAQEPIIQYFPGDNLFTPGERRRGLPIGNLTSQFWANVYLNRFDHFVKETLRVPGYIRYVDDFVLFGDNVAQLRQWRDDIQQYLNSLRLLLHPDKTQIYACADGVPFLGFRVFPHYRYVRKEKVKRYRRFLKKKIKHYHAGKITPLQLEQALNAWRGHIRFGQSKRLEYQVFWTLKNAGIPVFIHPNGAWKVLDYKP